MTATIATQTRSRVRLSRTAPPPPTTDIHQQHREWCQQAAEGDTQAANLLARAVKAWCFDTARKCAQSWGIDTVEPDDIAAVGLSRIPAAIKTYNGSGTWTGWFFLIARRSMNEYCQQTAAKKNRCPRAPDYELDTCPDSTQSAHYDRERHLADALCLLLPLEREIFTALHGYQHRASASPDRLRKRLGLSMNQLNRIYLRSHEIVAGYLRPRLDTL